MSYTDVVEIVVIKGVSSCKTVTQVNFAMWIVKTNSYAPLGFYVI